jgi:hypothetical protein
VADSFDAYEHRLKELLRLLGKEHPRYDEALTFQSRLLESIHAARTYGDTENLRFERNKILQELNRLALKELKQSFNELCGLPRDGPMRSVVALWRRFRSFPLAVPVVIAVVLIVVLFAFGAFAVKTAERKRGRMTLIAAMTLTPAPRDALMPIPTPAPTSTPAYTDTPSPTPTLAPTMVPTPTLALTPIPVLTAPAGEILALIVPANGNRSYFYTLRDALQRRGGESFRVEVCSQVISRREDAIVLAGERGVSLLVWGTFDNGVKLDFVVLDEHVPEPERILNLAKPDPGARMESSESSWEDSTSHIVNLALGLFYFHSGDYKRTVDFLRSLPLEDSSLLGDDQTALALLRLGTSYAVVGDLDQALGVLDSALSFAPESNHRVRALVLNNKAWGLGQMKRWSNALTVLREANGEAEATPGGMGLVALIELNYCTLLA